MGGDYFGYGRHGCDCCSGVTLDVVVIRGRNEMAVTFV
jgi:hypothetical protein